MSDQTNQVVTEFHLRTIEQYMAELAKSQAGQASALTELTSAVNRLVTRDEVRAEADKRIEGDLADLKKYKDYSEDIVKRAEKDQKFKDGLMQKVVYTLMASIVVGVLSYGGILIYDNAGSKNKTHQVNK
tara:strand:+ start:20629 stop:21018 length:390 start_codon:yes stop_codon:yes gene_type:complete